MKQEAHNCFSKLDLGVKKNIRSGFLFLSET